MVRRTNARAHCIFHHSNYSHRMDAQQRRDASLSMLENAIILLQGQELQGERTRLNEARERLGRLVDAAAAPTRDDNDDADSPRAEARPALDTKTSMRRRQRSDLSLAQGDSIHVAAKHVPFMVRPGSRYRIWWDVTTAILLVYVAIAEPFVVVFAPAFAQEASSVSYTHLTLPTTPYV